MSLRTKFNRCFQPALAVACFVIGASVVSPGQNFRLNDRWSIAGGGRGDSGLGSFVVLVVKAK